MMTVITEITIHPGQEPRWDDAFNQRFKDAPNQPGWLGVELLIPIDAPNHRVVVGTWRSIDDWEAWHETSEFQRTRAIMDSVEQESGPERWYDVVDRATHSS